MYRHPHGDDLLYIVWLKLGMQVAQKSEYLKARFGVQRGPTKGLTINGYQYISLMLTPIETSFFRQLLKCLSSIGVQILKEEIELFNFGVSGP